VGGQGQLVQRARVAVQAAGTVYGDDDRPFVGRGEVRIGWRGVGRGRAVGAAQGDRLVGGLQHFGCIASDRQAQAGAEERVNEHIGVGDQVLQGAVAGGLVVVGAGNKHTGVARANEYLLVVAARLEQEGADRRAFQLLGQDTRGNQAIATVVAGADDHGDARLLDPGQKLHDALGDSVTGALHHGSVGMSLGIGGALDGAHLFGGDNLGHGVWSCGLR